MSDGGQVHRKDEHIRRYHMLTKERDVQLRRLPYLSSTSLVGMFQAWTQAQLGRGICLRVHMSNDLEIGYLLDMKSSSGLHPSNSPNFVRAYLGLRIGSGLAELNSAKNDSRIKAAATLRRKCDSPTGRIWN